MRGAFDDDELEPARQRRDTEVTLGPTMQLALFLGLILLCVLCFSLGYRVGHHSHSNSAAASLPAGRGTTELPPASGTLTKPSAMPPSPPQQSAVAAAPGAAVPGTNPDGSPQVAPATGVAPAGQPQVRPAFPSQADTPQPGSTPQVQPVLPQTPELMVQVAAVSRTEDARVLVDALRKRGYAVTARREPSDGLIHVRIGPFNNRYQANAMSQKLLSDGYNAIIQP